MYARLKKQLLKYLEHSDIKINGSDPWDIQKHDEAFYDMVFKNGSLGLGESYMEGFWDCQRLDMLFEKIFRFQIDKKANSPLKESFMHLLAAFFNFQSIRRAPKGVAHYNLGHPLFKMMLDSRMIYSCGYFKKTTDLEKAQENKLKLCCEKLKLKPGETLLDIGCGWGGLARYAANHYDVSVVGLTLSKEQYDYASKICEGLAVEIRHEDYRALNQRFDKIVSVGMFEHVGHLNYSTFMNTIHQNLADNGLFLLHTIGVNETAGLADAWIRKYIFPNGMLPSVSQIAKASENLLLMEDLQNFGLYYDDTLMAWYHNFSNQWHEIKKDYDDKFFRMWTYYLLSCAGGFRARAMQLWQIVFSKGHLSENYISPR